LKADKKVTNAEETQLTDVDTFRASSARSDEVDGRSFVSVAVPWDSSPEAVDAPVLCLRTAANEDRNQEPNECLRRLRVRVDPIPRIVEVSLNTSSSLFTSVDGAGPCCVAEQKL